ncbi:MAG: phytoene/squalene synthase family protein [Candidatus Omnitrophica bacterium]|nr:phytoene/squalene synthase family protein [Candidatus Omnitrophota bacterium]
MHNEANHKALKSGFAQARKITRRHAKIFYFASHFLPGPKQNAAYAIYVACRDSDEAVDNMRFSEKQKLLDKIKCDIEAAYKGSALNEDTLLAFRDTIKKFNIPEYYFKELLEGMQMDLVKNRYQSFEELYAYCYKVAGVIGLIMLKVFGYDNPGIQKYAIDLGIAMQLTNILRDIKEDWDKGRVYLPQDELCNFGVSEEDIAEGKIDDNFKRLIQFQIKRARDYYASSREGIKLIDSRRMRFVILSMHQMYSGILDAIEHCGFDVFSHRAYTCGPRKAYIVLKNMARA